MTWSPTFQRVVAGTKRDHFAGYFQPGNVGCSLRAAGIDPSVALHPDG